MSSDSETSDATAEKTLRQGGQAAAAEERAAEQADGGEHDHATTRTPPAAPARATSIIVMPRGIGGNDSN